MITALYQVSLFTRIQRIYEFDRKLRTLVFEITEEIEFYLRTQFAYYSGHKYGPLGYLEEKNYISKHNHVLFQKKINERIQENQNTNVVKHHFEKYDGKFPIWVIIEFFSLGMLSYFFSDMKNLDKKTIARDLYDTTYDHLSSWTRCLTELRNRCAHYSRIYFWKFTSIPKEPEDEVYILDRSLFSQILMLKYLYPDAEKWNNKCIDELKTLIGEYLPDISLEHIGFPENWVDLIAK